jgi:transcription termination factor NusB
MFKKLEQHIGDSIDQIRNFTAEEAIIIRDAVSEGRLNLGNLSFLENINDVLRTIRDNADKTNANLSPQLEKMSKSMDNLNKVLGDLERKVATMQQGGGGIRKLFGGGTRSGDGA